MYRIEMRVCGHDVKGRWFRIWETQDGADCAAYLQQCVKTAIKGAEYIMRWVPSESPRIPTTALES
jgi:hypothetical protein